jgi:glycosyltransferase involved in cell wall biosynthesis
MRTIIDIRTASDHFPGIGRYTYHLVRELARSKDREQLLLISNPNLANTRFDIEALAAESDVRMVVTTAGPFTAREQLHLPGELRKLSPDVTHYPYFVMPYASPRPIVITIHDIIPIRFPQYFTFRQRVLYRISLSLALRSASCIICVSEATRSDLKSAFRVDPERIFVVYEGISERFHPRAGGELQRVRMTYGLPEKYLLYVGSNKPHKNLPLLIDAYARLHHAPSLILAGVEDSRYKEIRRRIDVLHLRDRVSIAGSINEEDLPALYSGASAFVFPSTYEGFGLPPLEAMACGVPVACSNISSLMEVAGDAALFFNANDPDCITAALERILRDEKLRVDLQDRGFHRSAELSWSLAAQKTRFLYRWAANL